jgi:uncharacterized protein YkwD
LSRHWDRLYPHEQRRLRLVGGLIALCFVGLVLALVAGCERAPSGIRVSPDETALIALHNNTRAAHGLGPMMIDASLQAAARAHARHMAAVGRMGHHGIGDGTPASRARAAGYRSPAVGENVAAGQVDPPAAMRGWMGSPGHRANILGFYSDFGVAVARGADGQPYWCAVFGQPGY